MNRSHAVGLLVGAIVSALALTMCALFSFYGLLVGSITTWGAPQAYEGTLTPIHRAARDDQLDLLSRELGIGTDVNSRLEDGATPLFVAAMFDNTSCVNALLRNNADATLTDHLGNSPMHVANSPEVYQLLIDAGADINAQENEGWTPLMKAAMYGNRDQVEWLIANGADVRIRDDRDRTVADVMDALKPAEVSLREYLRAKVEEAE